MRKCGDILYQHTGMKIDSFYRAFRASCAPPMVNIETIDVGQLWYYDGLSLSMVACIGKNHLMVAYDTFKSRQDTIDQFRYGYSWLTQEGTDLPVYSVLVFAAYEEDSGNIVVRRLSPGDWSGIPQNIPLPATERIIPRSWDEN
jgi:hypothetical protein